MATSITTQTATSPTTTAAATSTMAASSTASFESTPSTPTSDGADTDELAKTFDRLDTLSAQIYNFQKSNEQSPDSLCKKLYLRDLLYCAIAPQFDGCGLFIVGSTLNGFGTDKSDMDLCLMIQREDIDQRVMALVVLTKVQRRLEKLDWVRTIKVIPAKVPILRATFKAPFDKIIIDLNANNPVAIRNTHLLCYYSGYDWRVRPLVCTIKEWAKRRGINDANQSSLTSYSLALLVIHYLQAGVHTAILPSLQSAHQERFSATQDVRALDISHPLEADQAQSSTPHNATSLGDLLIGFFRYFAREFNFDEEAISVRDGKRVPREHVVTQKSPYNWLSQWRCICIEEPFTLSNAAHSVFDERVFCYIKEALELAYVELEKTRSLEDGLFKDAPIKMPMDLNRKPFIV